MTKTRMKAPKDVSSFSPPDKVYQIGKDGLVDIDDVHVEVAKRHGFVEAQAQATGATGSTGK